MNNSSRSLPDTITAPRTDPIYNCHGYLTKVPISAIKPFIQAFSEEGDTVADIFAGSGMTGIAALITNRNAKLSDISILGQHIAEGYLQDVSIEKFREYGDKVIEKAREGIDDLYTTYRSSDRKLCEIVRTVWSFTYTCPSCGFQLVYFEHLNENGKAPVKCPECKEPFIKRKWNIGSDVPVRIVVLGENGKQVEQEVSDLDIKHIKNAEKDHRLKSVPSLSIDQHREMYKRSALGKHGMTETSLFFSSRNAIALLELWEAINKIRDKGIKKKLKFVFTAILPRASKRYQWGPKRPLNAQNQTYYIAPVFYEWNVFDLLNRKINAAIRANSEIYNSDLFNDRRTEVSYVISSADKLAHLKNNSIDYVFTDPPFGSNIFYSDMNLFHEAWLGKKTNYANEAVVHTTGKKKDGSEERYESLLCNAFKEAYRVLKPGKYMSVVFGNSSGRIWGLVQRAIREAGFKATPTHVAILDKGQRSVKGLNSGSESVVTVDLVLTIQKPSSQRKRGQTHSLTNGDKTELIEAAINQLSSDELENPSHVYARVLQNAIKKNMVLDDLHLGDVLISLRNAGYSIDKKSGKLKLVA